MQLCNQGARRVMSFLSSGNVARPRRGLITSIHLAHHAVNVRQASLNHPVILLAEELLPVIHGLTIVLRSCQSCEATSLVE